MLLRNPCIYVLDRPMSERTAVFFMPFQYYRDRNGKSLCEIEFWGGEPDDMSQFVFCVS